MAPLLLRGMRIVSARRGLTVGIRKKMVLRVWVDQFIADSMRMRVIRVSEIQTGGIRLSMARVRLFRVPLTTLVLVNRTNLCCPAP